MLPSRPGQCYQAGLDDDYFSLVKRDVKIIAEIPILGVSALIPLKAKAFLDLSARKSAGEAIGSRDIKKHRTDVIKLIATLPDEHFNIPDTVSSDLNAFFIHKDIVSIDETTVRDIVGLSSSIEELISIAAQYYGLK